MTHSQPSTNSTWRENLASAAGSLLLHLTLLAVLSVLAYPLHSPIAAISTTVEIGEPTPPALETTISSVFDAVDDSASASKAQNPFLDQLTQPDADNTPRVELAQRLTLSATGLPAGSLNEEVGEYVAAAGSAETDDGAGDAQGAGNGSLFFGNHQDGDDVVFVVDCSRSMNHPHPGEAKTRFGRVKLELVNTISQMNSEQKFFMMFFNGGAVPMPADRMMEATQRSQLHFLTWMTHLKAEGVTNPEPALLMALSLQPDVIYFLTDGDFDYKVVPRVTQYNRSKIAINTIGFGDNRGEPFLKEIAAKNGGKYTFIPEPPLSTAKSIVTQLKSKTGN